MDQLESPQQTVAIAHTEVFVTVTYAGSRRGKWEHKYPADAEISTVRKDTVDFFGVSDHADEAGNQVVFELVDRGETLNVSEKVGYIAGDRDNVALRLVRRLIAG